MDYISQHLRCTTPLPAGTGSLQTINQPSAGFQRDSRVSGHSGVRLGSPWEWNGWGTDEAGQIFGPSIGLSLFLQVSWHHRQLAGANSLVLLFPMQLPFQNLGTQHHLDPIPLFQPCPRVSAGVTSLVWQPPLSGAGTTSPSGPQELPDAAPYPTPAASPRGGAGLEGGGDLMSS